MTTWYCAHDPAHAAIEADFNPLFCEARIGQRMTCGARMEEMPIASQQPATPTQPPTPQGERTVSKLIQMSSGAPDIAPGNYVVTLTSLAGPREATMPDGEVVNFFDWKFATDDGVEFEDSSTNKTGPKSKMRQWISALIGRPVAKDEGFDPADLVGRQAVVTIEDRDGWPRIANMGVLMQAPVAQQAPQAVAPPAAPPVQQVAPSPAVPGGSPPELPLG